MTTVPFHIPHFDSEDEAAALDVLHSRFTTMGTYVAEFEASFATAHGRKHAVMVNSCTNGHLLVFQYLRREMGLIAGTKALFPATTFAGPSFQAAHSGFDVEFVDTNPLTGASDWAEFLTVLPGNPSVFGPMAYAGVPLRGIAEFIRVAASQGHVIVEDCAHTVGATYSDGAPVGSLPSFASIYSFYPTKILNATEGGMILTDDSDLDAWCRAARLHGVNKPVGDRYRSLKTDWAYELPVMGHKCNPTNIQAAIGLSQLARLPRTLARLAEISAIYRDALKDTALNFIDGQASGNQHLFILRDTAREELMEYLKGQGVQCSVHYPALWKMGAWQGREWTLPGAERFAEGCLSLPIYADLTDAQIHQVCAALRSFKRV